MSSPTISPDSDENLIQSCENWETQKLTTLHVTKILTTNADAIQIYFRSKKEVKAQKEKNTDYAVSAAAKSRKEHKAQRRNKTFKNLTEDEMTKSNKSFWQDCMIPDVMSSEDELIEGDNKVFIVRKLKWRTKRFNKMVEKLDDVHKERVSSRGKFRMLP
ncbi:uncharacterized protein LOC130633153 isoform X2 [Hydractinia symbiolongicarpus]|nr:uncharacterized protein LOC130633153 isoform X2 [Hydractinia symbiolongicarpus]